ncbi:hypothetical protein MMC25_000498 [Agyrium rufum]|nr:hypothetical protein [Agyrium rufum]
MIVKDAFLSIGVNEISDHNAGNNKGLAPHVENWYQGKRQPAGKAYGLNDVDVLTNSMVMRIILEEGSDGRTKAIGAELTSGKIIKANDETILCCGTIRTSQILVLSGIGPAEELSKHNSKQLVDSPDVGRTLSDHYTITQFFKVRKPEKGLCAPSPAFNHPNFIEGFPTDYLTTESAPSEAIKAALIANGESDVTDKHPLLHPPRRHYELLSMYARTEVPMTNMGLPFDGSILSVGILNMLPKSYGTITLNSTDPADDPIIDPDYCATKVDRVILRAAIRRNMAVFETPEGQSIVEGEVPPNGHTALTSASTDAELDARVRWVGASLYHATGTAAMGKVVNTECWVLGVNGLRVVDAGVITTPIAARYQVFVYAIAEQMADIIASKK